MQTFNPTIVTAEGVLSARLLIDSTQPGQTAEFNGFKDFVVNPTRLSERYVLWPYNAVLKSDYTNSSSPFPDINEGKWMEVFRNRFTREAKKINPLFNLLILSLNEVNRELYGIGGPANSLQAITIIMAHELQYKRSKKDEPFADTCVGMHGFRSGLGQNFQAGAGFAVGPHTLYNRLFNDPSRNYLFVPSATLKAIGDRVPNALARFGFHLSGGDVVHMPGFDNILLHNPKGISDPQLDALNDLSGLVTQRNRSTIQYGIWGLFDLNITPTELI